MTQIGIEASAEHDPAYDIWTEAFEMLALTAKKVGNFILGQEEQKI